MTRRKDDPIEVERSAEIEHRLDRDGEREPAIFVPPPRDCPELVRLRSLMIGFRPDDPPSDDQGADEHRDGAES